MIKLDLIQLPINKLKGAGIKHFNDSEAFIEYSNDMGGIYKNTEECNQKKQKKNKNFGSYLII